jgi:hypothetical protein
MASRVSGKLELSSAGARPVLDGMVTPRPHDEGSYKIYSPLRGAPPTHRTNESVADKAADDFHETVRKTNHYAGICFGAAVVFMGVSFYDGYRLLSERTVSVMVLSVFWFLVAMIIGTAGVILQKTTKVETPLAPIINNSPVTLKEGQFPGMPNLGNTCFINAPTQAIMADNLYPAVYKAICEKAKALHVSYKTFLDLYSVYLPSWGWHQIFFRTREVAPPLDVKNVRDVLVVLARKGSSIGYGSQHFETTYPTINRLIGEFSKATTEAAFPTVADDDVELKTEFGLMKEDSRIIKFFDDERSKIATEILGFDAYLNLLQAYQTAKEQKLVVVSFGRWLSSPIGNVRYLIDGAGQNSQHDVHELLHCLSRYVLPDDFPEIFFSEAYERTWATHPVQDADVLGKLLQEHNSNDPTKKLTEIPASKKTVDKPSPTNILKLSGFLFEGVSGQQLIRETFEIKRYAAGAQQHYFIDRAGKVKNYYLLEESIIQPARMPDRMILQLNRFTPKKVKDRVIVEKNRCSVDMPSEVKICGQDYILKSIVMHLGPNAEEGHYVTLVHEGQWWIANDDKVDLALQAHVDQSKKDGYLFFFQKV